MQLHLTLFLNLRISLKPAQTKLVENWRLLKSSGSANCTGCTLQFSMEHSSYLAVVWPNTASTDNVWKLSAQDGSNQRSNY